MIKILKFIFALLLSLNVVIVCLFFYDQQFSNKYEQNVKVDYIVYTPTEKLYRSSIIKINGDKFDIQYRAYMGVNKVYILADGDDYNFLNHQPFVKVYAGTNYCEITKITILK